jgi:hypothetical protein
MSARHGMSSSAEFRIWTGIRTRCYNRRCKAYRNYGGRGIVMCERWRSSFLAFFADMGPRPSRRHSIDRINNEKGYEPGNCRWATWTQQNRNYRRCKLTESDVAEIERLYAAGAIQADLAEKFGVCRASISHILTGRNWSQRGISTGGGL